MRDADRVSYRYAGGESLGDILTRARSVTGRLDERTTLIVAHAGINRVLVAVLAGLEARLNDLYQPHDVIYRIGRAGRSPGRHPPSRWRRAPRPLHRRLELNEREAGVVCFWMHLTPQPSLDPLGKLQAARLHALSGPRPGVWAIR